MKRLFNILSSFAYAWLTKYLLDNCNGYMELDNQEFQWMNVMDSHGDYHVIPTGEEHTESTDCLCEPTSELSGSRLIVKHNAFDHREIIEQAMAIINGEDDE